MIESQVAQTDDLADGRVVTSPNVGEELEKLVVEIDYAILEHFSRNLYGSPYKAVEELVANGYDALAEHVFIYTDGQFAEGRLIVWDDGESMDAGDLHRLWWIARSPKARDSGNPGRIATDRSGTKSRPMIGKFGIGKLAGYAVGKRITHLCRRDGRFLMVGVDASKVPSLTENDGPGPSEQAKYETAIYSLTEEQARAYVDSAMRNGPAIFGRMWDQDSWTLAIIDELNFDVQIFPRRLQWILSTGMPLRPDFNIFVDDEEVKPRLASSAARSLDLNNPEVVEAITEDWATARADQNVDGDITFTGTGENRRLVLPKLGEVKVEMHLFVRSLHNPSDREIPRSYGYFIMVRGRLLNPDDPSFGRPPPSFGTFYRCQYVIQADGLDDELLADREHTRANTARLQELNVILDSIYRLSRKQLQVIDDRRALEKSADYLLPVESTEYFRDPVAALMLRHGAALERPFDPLTVANIERKAGALEEPLAQLTAESAGFRINVSHPLYAAIRSRIGNGSKALEALRLIELLAVSDRLLEGHLYDLGLEQEVIEGIVGWREGLLRTVAARYSVAPPHVILTELAQTSWRGGEPFETAIAKLFGAMGFTATRDGSTGAKDVLVVAPVGKREFVFTAEAKGSSNEIKNDAAEISGASAHAYTANASFAIVVAREFAGFLRPDDDEGPAILRECRRQSPAVSIVTLDTLTELYKAATTLHYPLTTLRDVLRVIESPAEKLASVRALNEPTEGFDFRSVLLELWKMQQDEASGDRAPWRTLWQKGPRNGALRWGVTDEDFERRLVALQTLAGRLVELDLENNVVLNQHPDIVVECIRAAVGARELAGDATPPAN